jgi:ankyrin repeat protein
MTSYRSLHAAASTPTCSAELLDLSISLFPNQVRELDEWGNLPLHYLVSKPACKHQHDHSGYICKLKKLLELFPQGASYRDGPSSQLAIHLAIENGHEWDMIRPLVNAFPESLTKPDVTQGLYAFQLAAYSKDSSLTATFELLRAAPYVLSLGQAHGGQKTEGSKPLPLLGSTPQPECNTEYVLRDIQGSGDSASISKVWRLLQFRVQGDLSPWKVLHSVASLPVRECPLALLEITLQIHGYELGEADRQGNLPLHIVSAQELEGIDEFSSDFDDMEDDACDPRTERVKVVVRDYPNAASIYDSNGLLPLHLAIYARHPWQSLQALLRAYPAAICQRGRRGLYPFQIAAARDAGLTEIFELILSAPHLLLDNSNEEEQPP